MMLSYVRKSLHGLYFLFMFLDAIAEPYSYGGIVKYMSYFAPCTLILIYSVSAKNENYFYMLSFLFNLLGLYFFNYTTLVVENLGIYFYGAGMVIYTIVALRDFKVKQLGNGVTRFLPFFLFAIFLSYLVVNKVTGNTVIAATLYSLIILMFLTITFFKYYNDKSNKNRLLLLSSVFIAVTTFLASYTFFWEKLTVIRFFAVITYGLGHFLMCKYMIVLQRERNKTPYINDLLEQ